MEAISKVKHPVRTPVILQERIVVPQQSTSKKNPAIPMVVVNYEHGVVKTTMTLTDIKNRPHPFIFFPLNIRTIIPTIVREIIMLIRITDMNHHVLRTIPVETKAICSNSIVFYSFREHLEFESIAIGTRYDL